MPAQTEAATSYTPSLSQAVVQANPNRSRLRPGKALHAVAATSLTRTESSPDSRGVLVT